MSLDQTVNRIKRFYNLIDLRDQYLLKYVQFRKGKLKKTEISDFSRFLSRLPSEDRLDIYGGLCSIRNNLKVNSTYSRYIKDSCHEFKAHVLD